jgi:hypothetical protein
VATGDPSVSGGNSPVNRLVATPRWDELLPSTTIHHLLSEEDAERWDAAQKAFAELGKCLKANARRRSLYPLFYDDAREQLATGMSADEVRVAMADLMDTGDFEFASIVREAYEDALAGRRPRHR